MDVRVVPVQLADLLAQPPRHRTRCPARPRRPPGRPRCAARRRTAAARTPPPRRQHVFDTASRLSSSLTAAVIATCAPLPPACPFYGTRRPRRRTSRSLATPPARLSRTPCHGRPPPARTGSCRGAPRPATGAAAARRPATRRTAQAVRRRHRVRVGDHRVDPQPGCVLAEYVQMLLRGEPSGLPRLRDEVQDHHRLAVVSDQRLVQLRHQQVRQHAGEPRARAEQTTSASSTASTAASHAFGSRSVGRGVQPDPLHLAGRGRDRDLAADPPHRPPGPRRGRPRPPRCPAARRTSAAPGPAAPSSRAASSSAATGSPRISISPASRGCRPRARRARRCRRTGAGTPSAHSGSPSPSPASAASAIRRSPGGSRPSSRRSRPDDPPSSATVTTAVTSVVSRRSAVSVACRPCPPPERDRLGSTLTRAPGRGARPSPPCRPRRRAAGRVPRRWRRCGACRRCSRRRASGTACPRAGSRRRSAAAARGSGRGTPRRPPGVST